MMAPISDSPPTETQETEQQEHINPIEWAGSGTAGRVTQRNQANTTAERLMSIMANTQRALSPAGSSEGSDSLSSSLFSASRTQHSHVYISQYTPPFTHYQQSPAHMLYSHTHNANPTFPLQLTPITRY